MPLRSAVIGPALDADLYSTSAVEDSQQLFSSIRACGRAVWLTRNRMWAIGRYEDVRAALRDDGLFRSGSGVAANPLVNVVGRDTTLSSDDSTHDRRRKVMMRSLGAKALSGIEQRLESQATALIDELMSSGEFDAAGDFASRLPLSVVANLVGVRRDGEQLLDWAAATFNALGPFNRRGAESIPTSLSMVRYMLGLKKARVAPGSWAASAFEACEQGELSNREAKALVIDFVGPSLDTTILASTHMLWLLAKNPQAWDAIVADPNLITPAVVEAVRLASPIRCFTRRLAADHQLGEARMRKGSRAVLLFASANMDDTQFAHPGRFDLGREQQSNLAWGNGPHTCVGIHLAKLEMRALLEAMVPRVRRIEVGEPTRLQNNTLQGFTHLPATFA
jgi:cytochrome P450